MCSSHELIPLKAVRSTSTTPHMQPHKPHLLLMVWLYRLILCGSLSHPQSTISSDANQPNFDLVWEDLLLM